MQVDGDLLIGFAVEVAHEDAPLKVAEDFLHFLLDVDELLVTDDELLGVADARTGLEDLQSMTKEELIDALVMARITEARLKKGYLVEGVGVHKKFIPIGRKNTK